MTAPYCEGVTHDRCEDDFTTERDRIVHRLQVMPERLREAAYALTLPVLAELRRMTLTVDAAGPADVPHLDPRAAGDQLLVITADFASACDDEQRARATALLTELRRALP